MGAPDPLTMRQEKAYFSLCQYNMLSRHVGHMTAHVCVHSYTQICVQSRLMHANSSSALKSECTYCTATDRAERIIHEELRELLTRQRNKHHYNSADGILGCRNNDRGEREEFISLSGVYDIFYGGQVRLMHE